MNNKDGEITTEEYVNALTDLKKKTAPRKDNISNEVITGLPDSAHERLRSIFNEILSKGVFPKEWKEYIVVLIPKPGNKGFRPISSAQNSFKLMEKMIAPHYWRQIFTDLCRRKRNWSALCGYRRSLRQCDT